MTGSPYGHGDGRNSAQVGDGAQPKPDDTQEAGGGWG